MHFRSTRGTFALRRAFDLGPPRVSPSSTDALFGIRNATDAIVAVVVVIVVAVVVVVIIVVVVVVVVIVVVVVVAIVVVAVAFAEAAAAVSAASFVAVRRRRVCRFSREWF